ncbi:MAG: bifunctional 5,10-methylenetetrahydrofolate dehydrogenase/5,10-methenyltetrahydrofolate cyclohydrolase, partial [Candidatus Pacebacteria bacterium]|nr:bifunctional 5,10-methylenetetrahydrofolate dehydrogenase/5,10-methenyltetrahydrofolate cyclohydrolase [Candidatus Paceibacterota bacterium]
MKIIDGKKISKETLEEIKNQIQGLNFKPIFSDILVGNDAPSVKYVNLKKAKAEDLGIEFYDANFDDNITTEELINKIQEINKIENMCGVIVQLPLPISIDTKKVLDSIDPKLDVDCLGGELSSQFYNGDLFLSPPTAIACMHLLDSLNLNLNDKKILIVGEGKLVGKPLANIMHHRGLNFEIINSRSSDKEELIKNADIIITGVGKGKIINGDMVKDGVIIIDAGTSEEDSVLVGDVDFESASPKASFITPVPGGV